MDAFDTITTIEDWQTACKKVSETGCVLVLQIGASWCKRCPPLHDHISKLKEDYKFEWVYSDASKTDLVEHFEIQQLPAVVIFQGSNGKQVWKKEAVAPNVVEEQIHLHCPIIFSTSADF